MRRDMLKLNGLLLRRNGLLACVIAVACTQELLTVLGWLRTFSNRCFLADQCQ